MVYFESLQNTLPIFPKIGGSIIPGGVFEAKLDESIAEYGEGVGTVTATYTHDDGEIYLGKTEIFKVEAFVPEDTGTEG